jgi:preprotein translocase subunit YajC
MTVPVLASFVLLQSTGGALAPTLFMYAAIFAIFYFVLLRPQQKAKRQHQDLVANLKKGDEVVTAGGVVGEVQHIAQNTKDKDGNTVAGLNDRITIKSGDARLVVERGRITQVLSGTVASS